MCFHTWVLSVSRGESRGLINEGTAYQRNSVIKVHLYVNRTVNKHTMKDISYIRYPFIQPFATDFASRGCGGTGVCPTCLWTRSGGAPWKSPGQTHSEKQPFTLIPESTVQLSPKCMFMDRLRKPTYLERALADSMQTPQGKAPRTSNNN